MSNTYFQFRQFRVEQQHSAMKVTTDACIQGAWTPVLPGVENVLDIGAGTGLLSLMLTQRSADVVVDAIELDEGAAREAEDNVQASPWGGRVRVMQGDVRVFPFAKKYDLIICNPPFFSNSLLSAGAAKRMARHAVELSGNELAGVIASNLEEIGYASVLLPVAEYEVWKAVAMKAGLMEHGALHIRHTPLAPGKRIVGLFSKGDPTYMQQETLVIRNDDGEYSADFRSLLGDFYLAL